MGIKNLTSLIKSKAPDTIETKGLYSLKGKKIAVDASILIYKSLTNVRKDNSYLTNKDGKVVSHIFGLFHKTIQFQSFGIEPIFIFDGKPPEEKKNVLIERNKKVKESKILMEQTTDNDEKKKIEKSTIRIKKEHIDDLKQLFTLMGISYVHPNCEAETYAAYLSKKNIVYGVYSEDMDTLAFGSPYLIRNCIDRTIKRRDVVSIFSLEKLLEGFNMNYEQFVELCVLSGCDYCGTIPRIGNVRAFSGIQKFNNATDFIHSLDPNNIPEDYLLKLKRAKSLFMDINFDESDIISSTKNDDKLGDYLINQCNMSVNRVQNALKKINKLV